MKIINDLYTQVHLNRTVSGIKIPYINVTNSYWVGLNHKNMPLPETPLVRMIGKRLATIIFECGRETIVQKKLSQMVLGMNKVRAKFMMPTYKNFFDAYLDSDLLAFADDPTVYIPPDSSKYNYIFLGPIVYLNLGSSGHLDLLPKIIKELVKLPIQLVVGGIDDEKKIETYPNSAKVFKAKFFPGEKLCEISKVVIFNGGSPTAHQALAAGKPIIGITRNMDQVLNMNCLQKLDFVRAHNGWSYSVSAIRKDVESFLKDENYSQMARDYQASLSSFNLKQNFLEALKSSKLL